MNIIILEKELAFLVRAADPDLCLGWELSRSWGLLVERAKALLMTMIIVLLK